MYNEVIKLVTRTKTVNDFGDITVSETERQVFADLRSIGQSEFYQASAVGLKPEIKFVLPDFLEWEGETLIRYKAYDQTDEQDYTVLRTYRTGNQLEIVCTKGVEQ